MSTDNISGDAPTNDIVATQAPSPAGENVASNVESTVASASSDPSSHWLPDALREEPSLKVFKDAAGLAKSYMSLNSERGRSIRIPGEDAGSEDMDKFYSKVSKVKGMMRRPDVDNPEAMSAFYNSLGRPEKSQDYKVDGGDNAQYLDNNTVESFKSVAHDIGLTSNQLQKVIEFDLSRNKAQSEADVLATSNGIELLQKRWGSEYNNRIAGAKSAFATYEAQFPEGFKQLEAVAKNNPALIAMLSDLGKTMHEKGFIDAHAAYGGDSPKEAKEKISEIRNNKSHPYHNPKQPGHQEAREKMRQFYKNAFPSPQS